MKELNQEQKQAVTYKNGPLLIIAGAGTGKTHVITSRILYLLEKNIAKYSEILALTFTEKATEEMKERIDRALPYSYEEIAIHTFHSFCDRILRENGLEIGLDTSYKILSQIDQWMFIKKYLFEFDLDYYRPLGNPNKFITALANHFSRLKDEDISPVKYISYANKEKYEKLKELANAYKKYQELLINENSLDFNDLTYFVLRLFEKRPKILKEYQDRYKNILVDEFQDTNYIQSKIVHLLAEKHKNITVVGDDDQSIYRWRGASMTNILHFEKKYPNCKKVILKQNYRSTPQILNSSYELIQNNNPYRLENTHKIDKKLISQMESGDKVNIQKFSHYFYENKFIINKVLELLKNKKNKYTYKDFAVLVRAHSHAKPVIEELKEKDIPFQVRNNESLFTLPEIKDIISVLKFITNLKDDIALFRILTITDFNLPMKEILKLLNKVKEKHDPLFEILEENKDDDLFKGIFEILNKLIKFSKNHSITQTITEFLEKSRYLHRLQKNESIENEEKIINIAEFLRMVQEFESEHTDNTIFAFLEYLKLLEDAGGHLEPNLSEFDLDAVQILSIHAAKGLEFPVVFIPSVVQHRFPSIGRKEAIEIPNDLINEEIPEKDMHLYEERRLFYVACTRAKQKLFISYSEKYEGTKKWKPSIFINELEESSETISNRSIGEELKPEQFTQKEEASKAENINISLPVHNLSYSKLETFDSCPLKYKFRYLFQIPSPQMHAANFGSSVHNTLNEFYKHLYDRKHVSLNTLKEIYKKNWIPYGYASKAHENTRKKKGLEKLELYYKKNSNEWVIPYLMEKKFTVKIDDYSITGRIDRIDELEDKTFEIIDYKTGKLKKGTNLQKDLQLSIYALACRDVFKLPVSKLSLYFLEDNQKVSTERTNEQLEKAKVEIKEKCEALQNSDFCATPGFACKFCEYRLICNKAIY